MRETHAHGCALLKPTMGASHFETAICDNGCGSQLNRRGYAGGVHVSTYQGSILVAVEPQPMCWFPLTRELCRERGTFLFHVDSLWRGLKPCNLAESMRFSPAQKK